MKHQNKLVWQLLRIIPVIVLVFYTISTVPAQTAPQIAEKALAATVYLEMQDSNGVPLGFGSGFFVGDNLIATNYHVIEGAARGTAKLVGQFSTYTIEGVTATDKTNDLALLKVRVSGINPLPLGNSSDVKIGETVYVAGNPRGLEGTFSDGIISSRRDPYTKERLQMTAPISPGSSGGPVLNSKGEVIGVSFMTLVGGQNLNFAIPSRYLTELLTESTPAKSLAEGNRSISAETYFTWGNTKAGLGDYKGAIADYDIAIRLKPDDAIAYYNRGTVKDELGQHSAAIVDFDTAIRIKPDYADAYNNRGIAKSDLGQHFAAIADYDTAIRINPDYATAYYNRGIAKSDLGQHFAAIADYDTVIRIKPDYVNAYYNRGTVKSDLGQHLAAIVDFDTAIRIKPDYATAYYNRGIAKSDLGQHFAAIADYDTAIRIKPDYVNAYNNRGNAKSDLGQHFAAIADYDTVIRINPDDATAYYNRGNAKGELGQHSAAIVDFDTAIRIKPDDADAYLSRGVAKALLNRISEAKQDVRTALRLAKQAGDTGLITRAEKVLRILEGSN